MAKKKLTTAEQKKKHKNLTAMGKGRKKGSRNRFTQLKNAFLDAFDKMGGAKELANWGKKSENRSDFYKMITRLFPKDIKLESDEPITVVIKDYSDYDDPLLQGKGKKK